MTSNIKESDIDEAIKNISSGNSNSSNQALEQQLRNYIQVQVRNGYSIDILRSTLIGQGFDQGVVGKVINDINNGNVNINVKHEVNFSSKTIIGISIAIILIGIVIYGVFNLGLFQNSTLLDISISTDSSAYLAGDNINYQIQMTNMGSQNRFDATVKYIISDDANTVLARKEETLAVETNTRVSRTIQIPQNLQPGKYYLVATADYGNKQAKSSIEFEVVATEQDKTNAAASQNIPANNQNNLPAQGQQNNNGQNTNDNTNQQVVGGTTITFGQEIDNIKREALTNPNAAIKDCDSIGDQEHIEICYSTVAETSQNTNYCEYIKDDSRKDNCYMSFVVAGNTEVCDKITDANNKDFCKQLNIVQQMNEYYKENNTEKILELSKQFNPGVYNSNPQVQTYEYHYNDTVTILAVSTNNNATSNSSGNNTNSTTP